MEVNAVILEKCGNYFLNIFNISDDNTKQADIIRNDYNNEAEIPMGEVQLTRHKLKNQKTSSVDNTWIELIKYGGESII